MRTPSILLTSIALLASVAIAQDDAQYKSWMQAVGPAMRGVGGADEAAAKADATKLADTFDHVATFWKAKNADDAVKFAETARDAAKDIASGTGDKAANVQKIRATCGGCHSAHRGGSAPNFTIK